MIVLPGIMMLEVFGNEFRPVKLPLSSERGGILARLLAMNSDGKIRIL